MANNYQNPNVLTVLSPDLFTFELYDSDNGLWGAREPCWQGPLVLGVCRASNIPCRPDPYKLAIMLEDKAGNVFWHHANTFELYSIFVEDCGFSEEEINLLRIRLGIPEKETL